MRLQIRTTSGRSIVSGIGQRDAEDRAAGLRAAGVDCVIEAMPDTDSDMRDRLVTQGILR